MLTLSCFSHSLTAVLVRVSTNAISARTTIQKENAAPLMCSRTYGRTNSTWIAVFSDLTFCAASLCVTQSHNGAHVAW